MKSAVLILSGGMDSATLMYHLLAEGYDLRCLSIDYGQRHIRELVAAKELCEILGVEHKTAPLIGINPLFGESSLTNREVDVPEGHYEDENMKVTVVPNRNMIMLAVAAAWGISTKSGFLAYAAHAGDHTIYPDCRPEFIEAMAKAIAICDFHGLELIAPFQGLSKGEICSIGLELGVPFEKTWTCYKGGDLACGKCGSCTERLEAFEFAGAKDPLPYEVDYVPT